MQDMKEKDKKTQLSVAELLDLQQSKSHLDTIMDNSMDVVVLTDSKGYIVRVNRYFIKLLDCEHDEVVIGKHISEFGPTVNTTYKCTTGEFVHISDKFFADTRKMYERFVEEKKKTNWQSYFVSKKDILIPVEQNMSYFHDEKGNVVGALAIIRDITERKRAEKEINEGKDFLRNIIESSMDGIVIVDEKGYIISVNSALIKMSQFDKEQLIGEHISILTAEDKDIKENILKKTKELFEKGYVSYESKHKMGKENCIDVECNISLVKDDKGNNIAGIAIIRDITGRKKTEEALLESEGKFRSVVNNIAIGISLISPNMEILSLNNQMQQWFPEADVSQKPICYKTFNNPPRKSICSYCPTIKTLQDGQIHESISDTPRGDKFIHYRIISSPLKDKEGRITSAIEMVDDITERKKIEEQMLNYQKHLKALTSQITLSEEQERRRLAEYLHNEIGQYLLASLIQLKLLKVSMASTENVNTLDRVLNNIEQMIDKSRFLTLELSSPILYELGLEKALEWLAEHTGKQYNLMVTFEDDKQEKPLDDDMKIFSYRAVLELLTNVAKHAQSESAILSIKKDTPNIRICVKDNGVGFTSSDQHSSDDMRKGFGLFHIKERLEQFGGQLEIESQPNCGTKITLIVPLKNTT